MKRIKTLTLLLISIYSIFIISACNTNNKETDIITTLYFQYDIVNNIVKDKMSVSLITPLGTEVHGFEPTPRDIININKSKLFIYTSDDMEPWAINATSKVNSFINLKQSYINNTNFNILDNIHYWTDPLLFIYLINIIKDEIILIDPINFSFYENNANNYINNILDIHNELNLFFENNNYTVYFYGHNALSNFASRYNFTISSLFESFNPESELTHKQLNTLKENIINNNVKYLFTEELVDLKGVNSFVNSLKNDNVELEILELHSYHNITVNQFKKGVSYYDLLLKNYENLKKSLS